MEREELVDLPRLGANSSTELYHPHYGQNVERQPVQTFGAVGVITTIKRGLNGVGASYEWNEPVNGNWHPITSGALVTRRTGA